MIVVDSSALIAILRREPEAELFIRIITDASGCLMSAVGLLETSMVLAGHRGDQSAWAELDAALARARMTIVPHDDTQANIARNAFLRYGKGRHPAALNMGDCAAYALAKVHGLPLLFKGDDFTRTDLTAAVVP